MKDLYQYQPWNHTHRAQLTESMHMAYHTTALLSNSCDPMADGLFRDPKGRSYPHLNYWTHRWRIDINIIHPPLGRSYLVVGASCYTALIIVTCKRNSSAAAKCELYILLPAEQRCSKNALQRCKLTRLSVCLSLSLLSPSLSVSLSLSLSMYIYILIYIYI